MNKEFNLLPDGCLFDWQDRIYQKLRDVFVHGQFDHGLVQSMFVKVGDKYVASMSTDTERFNPYSTVRPVRITFETDPTVCPRD